MTATPTKKKLCWNCDGNVPLRAEHCPYCGVYIEQSGDLDDLDEPEEEDHAPPYVMSSPQKANTASAAPTPPYSSRLKKNAKSPTTQPKATGAPARSDAKEPLRQVVVPLLLLICGSVFALFGLVLLLFSDNGVFVLKWNGDHWPYYLVAGLIALLAGWRLIGKVDEPSA